MSEVVVEKNEGETGRSREERLVSEESRGKTILGRRHDPGSNIHKIK
jgi:hypothetical protein